MYIVRMQRLTEPEPESDMRALTVDMLRLKELEAWLEGEAHRYSSEARWCTMRCCSMSLVDLLQTGHLCRDTIHQQC